MDRFAFRFSPSRLLCFLLLGFAIWCMFQINMVLALEVETYSIDENPYGISYEDWTKRWWQWLMSMPDKISPAAGDDPDGKKCGQNQSGPVWFLAGTLNSGKADRTCLIDKDLSIFFPIIAGFSSYLSDTRCPTIESLKNCAIRDNSGAVYAASINGTDFDKLQIPEITTQPFEIYFPVNNTVGSPVENTTAVANGWYLFLKPLPPGNYELAFKGNVIGNPMTGAKDYAVELKYHLTVK